MWYFGLWHRAVLKMNIVSWETCCLPLMTTTFLFSTWDRWKFIKVDSWDLPNTPIGLLFSLNACSITWLSRNQSFSTPFKFALWPIQLFSLSAHFTRAHTVRPQHRATVCCVLINPVSGTTTLHLSLFKDFYCRTQTVASHILQNSAHSDIRSHAYYERGSQICECNLQSNDNPTGASRVFI
jgi:hypothetical protein